MVGMIAKVMNNNTTVNNTHQQDILTRGSLSSAYKKVLTHVFVCPP